MDEKNRSEKKQNLWVFPWIVTYFLGIGVVALFVFSVRHKGPTGAILSPVIGGLLLTFGPKLFRLLFDKVKSLRAN